MISKSKDINRRCIILGLILSIIFTIHLISPITQLFDSHWIPYTTVSIIKQSNTNLDEYESELKQNNYAAIENIDTHYYTIFPIGTSVLSLPIIFPLVYFFNDNINSIIESNLKTISLLFPLVKTHYDAHYETISSGRLGILAFNPQIQVFTASIFVTITALFMYLISKLFLDYRRSIAITLIFAFCTSSWSTASRALWQHGPSMLMLSICLYLLLLARNKPWLVQLVSLPLAFSYVIRPTNSLSILVFSLFILIKYRKYFIPFVAWGLTIGVPFIVYNWSIYGQILSPYYLPSRLGSSPYFWEALAGNLISPSRGLFIFTPIFLFSLGGMAWLVKSQQARLLDYCLVVIIVLHWLSISSFPHWWAGFSYGPRFFSDMIPYFMYFLIRMFQGIQGIQSNIKENKKKLIISVIILFAMVSFFIHYRGANHYQVNVWNSTPVTIDEFPERLWDWRDIQFMRGL